MYRQSIKQLHTRYCMPSVHKSLLTLMITDLIPMTDRTEPSLYLGFRYIIDYFASSAANKTETDR